MKKYLPILILLLAPLLGASQASLELQVAAQLIEKGNYRQAGKVAQQAYQKGNIEEKIEARILQAKALDKSANLFNRKKINDRIELLLTDAYRKSEQMGMDSMNQVVNTMMKDMVDVDMNKPATPLTAGGKAAQPPNIRDIAKRKIQEFNSYNDSLNAQLSALKIEKDELEQAISQLTLEQAQQQLMLARKEKTIDSIAMARMQDSLLVVAQEEALQRQEVELALKETQRNRSFLLTIGIIIIAGILFWLYYNTSRKNKIIESERARSDELLLNILPASVALELKSKGKADARHYDQVTVLFSDFKDFTKISSNLSPQELVAELDECFQAFDRIVEQYQLEKIKTIGDAYMCAGGLPEPSEDHAQRTIQAAMEMQNWLRLNNQRALCHARIGIHSGPVIAGVVGARKFAYDIWGNTVNIASRMESQGMPGEINISQATYELSNNQFQYTSRGKIPAKGIGEIEMYFIKE